jgi:hypothetical protein
LGAGQILASRLPSTVNPATKQAVIAHFGAAIPETLNFGFASRSTISDLRHFS